MDDMDGLCHGKSYAQVDDLGIPLLSPILGNPNYCSNHVVITVIYIQSTAVFFQV